MLAVQQNGGADGHANVVQIAGQDIRLAAPNLELQALPEYLKKECLLFYYPDTESLAQQIASLSDSVELGSIRWR